MFKLFKQTSYSSDQALLENKARPDQLPFFLNFLHNFSLSLQFPSPQPSPLLPQPVHDERKALLAATEGLLTTQPRYKASCISWHNISRAMWQLKATFTSSQSSRKRDLQPDWSRPVASGARLSTLRSHCSEAEVPSLSVHDSHVS